MDSVLRTALFEIMKIFENALNDQKVQLTQKAAEISQLKVKLQRAELKLKDLPSDCPRQAKKQTKVVPDASATSPAVARADFAGSDERCDPLGCETVKEGLYPNMKLRPFSIQLSHIPVETQAVDISLQRKGPSKSSEKSPNTKSKHALIKAKSNYDQQNQKHQKNNTKNMLLLLKDNRHKYSNIEVLKRLRTRKTSEKNVPKDNPSDQRNSAVENNPKNFPCRCCNKMFTTKGGLHTHMRYHKTCQGCRNVFPYVEYTNIHKQSCKIYKKWIKKEANNSKNACEEDDVPALSKSQVTIKEEPMEISVNPMEVLPVRHFCKICNMKFKVKTKFDKHMRLHTDNTWPCSVCSRSFCSLGSLKGHTTRVHKDPSHFFDANGDLGWTMPLEDFEDN
uniref:C2H2-type domain-containing protein n=1 Tax=Iconisemion striatum TaxID=60296 RepID=A0A1A7W662_9TELE